MTSQIPRTFLAVLLITACLPVSSHAAPADILAPVGPNLPAAHMRAVPATIDKPAKPIFDVRKYGAKGDGTTYDTVALQKAIDACGGTGGTVILSQGSFLTAQLTLRPKMTLFIDKSAVLLGGTNPEDYPVLMPAKTAATALRRSILFADHADHLVLNGGGTIDGQGPLVKMTGKEPFRPSLLRIFSSNDVIVRNLTLKNPRMWTDIYSECDHLTIDHLKVISPAGYAANLDGVDVCDCSNTVVSNCDVQAEDDGICLKSHGPLGLHNVTVENNTIRDFVANGIKIGTASHGPVDGIKIINNTVTSSRIGGVCIESVDGSVMKDILVDGLDLYDVAQPIFIRLGARTLPAGSISGVTVERVRAISANHRTPPSCTICGIPSAHIGDIVIRDCYIEMPGGIATIPSAPKERESDYPESSMFGNTPAYGFYVRHADNVILDHVIIGRYAPDARPWLTSDDAKVATNACQDRAQISKTNPPKP
jgi:polygalacturonase